MKKETRNLLFLAGAIGIIYWGQYLYGRWWMRRMNIEKAKILQYAQQQPGQGQPFDETFQG